MRRAIILSLFSILAAVLHETNPATAQDCQENKCNTEAVKSFMVKCYADARKWVPAKDDAGNTIGPVDLIEYCYCSAESLIGLALAGCTDDVVIDKYSQESPYIQLHYPATSRTYANGAYLNGKNKVDCSKIKFKGASGKKMCGDPVQDDGAVNIDELADILYSQDVQPIEGEGDLIAPIAVPSR